MRFLLSLLFLPGFLVSAQIRFNEIAAKAGLQFELRNGAGGRYHLVELMPGGVAALDFDNDSCTDLYFTNGASLPSLRKTGPEFHNRLYRNNCDLTFTDVTGKAGVEGEGYSMAVAAGDYDNDGNADIFVAGVNRNILYHNLGDGTFEDVTTQAGLSGVDAEHGEMWSISAGWFDYNNDGWLDLFVSNYVVWDPRTEKSCGPLERRFYCHPDYYQGLPNQLFHNNGDGTFTDASAGSGIALSAGKGMGVAFADFNADGWPDVFVANDSVANFLFENKGNGKFQEIAWEAGVALADHGRAIAGMGVDFRDFDNDGLSDVLVTGMINDTYLLFRNQGKALLFEDYRIPSGLVLATKQLTGWGVGMYDLNNDGWKDLFFANSHFPQIGRFIGSDSALANRVFLNLGGGRFEDISKGVGEDFQASGHHRGATFADFDNDGKVDVVVTALNAPAKLFRNVTPGPAHWIAIKLVGSLSNRDGIGAKICVTLPGGERLYNHATSSVGYASSSELIVRFGLGSHRSAERVEIHWPSGRTQELKNVEADRVVEVEEPKRRQ